MNTDVMFSSKSNEWTTPQALFEELDKEFNFNLDPSSTDENCKCEKHYTARENGLLQTWGGTGYSAPLHTAERYRTGARRRMRNGTTQRSLYC